MHVGGGLQWGSWVFHETHHWMAILAESLFLCLLAACTRYGKQVWALLIGFSLLSHVMFAMHVQSAPFRDQPLSEEMTILGKLLGLGLFAACCVALAWGRQALALGFFLVTKAALIVGSLPRQLSFPALRPPLTEQAVDFSQLIAACFFHIGPYFGYAQRPMDSHAPPAAQIWLEPFRAWYAPAAEWYCLPILALHAVGLWLFYQALAWLAGRSASVNPDAAAQHSNASTSAAA
jgi:hypothetical protein